MLDNAVIDAASYIGPEMSRSASETLFGFIKPELPILVPEPPAGEGWIHEIKYDGYRTLIVIDRGQVRAFTRNGNDLDSWVYRRDGQRFPASAKGTLRHATVKQLITD